MNNERVIILLASYNGEKFIDQQINSILNQTYENWQLLVRDDCSTDNTLGIIKKYASLCNKITLVESNGNRLGAQLNFGALMYAASTFEFNYCMFSDQDDVWYEDKIADSVKCLEENLKRGNYNGPALLHTDFQYTDNDLNSIHVSANVAIKLSKLNNKIKLIANDNYIFGCTMMLNKALLKLCIPVSPEAENHDFWVSLHAALFGKIYYLNKKTMLYRQHQNNVSGGLKYSSWKNRLLRIFNFKEYITQKRIRVKQFESFIAKEGINLNAQTLDTMNKYLEYSHKGGINAVVFMMKNGFKLRGFYQTAIYYLSVLIDDNNNV